ncbi:PucR family transcriptional regulator ligand-binding domain-containing protein [Desulfosporosinus sp. PR]|uniref:PucR family transcriptional regulator n=1 Tax=Candidatus Desulfosporosinus nitrosoreducens TaxID=3401928 RepID=UPI0027FB1F96|nr:PucR family transcriptional regulator ligand-binding domain-containing protein [Desulfosporosinus sp. PR]MDQ7096384.1 PucR family transcriptional regulator ligand-binding domain-containing protein [Desulfosporosinus sp. PR]
MKSVKKQHGVTVKDILRLPILKNAKLVGGLEGLNRIVRSIDIMEIPEIKPWLREGEILLTTTYSIRNEPNLLPKLVEDLAQAGAAALVFKPERFILQIPEEMIEVSNRYQLPVIAIPAETPSIDITHSVMELVLNWRTALLSRAEEIGTKLTTMVLENQGLQALAENVSKLLDAPISVLDNKGCVIAQSPEARILDIGSDMKWNITVNKRFAGQLVVHKESLDAMEQVCVDQARVVFSLELMRKKTAEETEIRLRGNFIDELLSDLPPSELEAKKKGRQLDFDADTFWEVSLIEGYASKLDEAILSDLRALLISEGKRKNLRPHMEIRGTQILLFLPAVEGESTFWSDVLKLWIDHHLEEDKARIRVGIGNKYFLWNMYKSYREARKALEIGWKMYSQYSLIPYENIEVYEIIANAAENKELSNLFQKKLGKLLLYDQETRSELLKTLFIYLELGKNMQETAKRLFIHRNSVKYRLERIEEIAQLDLSSAQQCFIYHLCLTWYLLK